MSCTTLGAGLEVVSKGVGTAGVTNCGCDSPRLHELVARIRARADNRDHATA